MRSGRVAVVMVSHSWGGRSGENGPQTDGGPGQWFRPQPGGVEPEARQDRRLDAALTHLGGGVTALPLPVHKNFLRIRIDEPDLADTGLAVGGPLDLKIVIPV